MTGSGRLAVLVAVDDEPSAVALLATLEAEPTVVVARRCVDVADLVGAAAAGIGRVALVSSGLRQLDGGMLDRLRQADVGIVGVVPAAGDPEAGERRLRQLGVARVVGAGVGRPELTTVLRAAAAGIQPPGDPGRPAGVGPARIPAPQTPAPEESARAPWPEEGQVVAVWGPAGAPGRTSLAVNVAAELATGTGATLLVDADTYAASIAQLLGMLEEAPGIAAAARLADAGTLDVPALAGCARDLGGGLLVLTGLPRADRWPEVRGPAAGVVLSRARALARWTVVDCGFCLEDDEELSYDTVAPRRNAVTLAVLEEADVVLVVGAAEPVGIARLLRGLAELRAAVPGATPLVVLNKVRGGGPAGAVARDAATLLARHAGVTPVATVPYDGPAFDAALAAGRTLAESGNAGPARAAIGELARLLTLRAAAHAPGRRSRAGARAAGGRHRPYDARVTRHPHPPVPAPVTVLRGLLLDAFGVLDDTGGTPGATPVADAAGALRRRGVRVALVSNVPRPDELPAAWRGVADTVVCSGEVGVAKPDPGIYRTACARLGLPPAACVFIDDSGGHVRAAVELGLVGVHHRTVEATLAELAVLFPGAGPTAR